MEKIKMLDFKEETWNVEQYTKKIQEKTTAVLNETMKELSKEEAKKLIKELQGAKNTEESVAQYAKIMDTYGLDAIIGLIPALGDISSSAISSLFLMYQGSKVGLSSFDTLKLLGYQALDAAVWAIPVIGDIADYLFKANKKSAEIFEKHVKKIEKKALAKGLSQEEIDRMKGEDNKMLKLVEKLSLSNKQENSHA